MSLSAKFEVLLNLSDAERALRVGSGGEMFDALVKLTEVQWGPGRRLEDASG